MGYGVTLEGEVGLFQEYVSCLRANLRMHMLCKVGQLLGLAVPKSVLNCSPNPCGAYTGLRPAASCTPHSCRAEAVPGLVLCEG
jgi:hypothetical protein